MLTTPLLCLLALATPSAPAPAKPPARPPVNIPLPPPPAGLAPSSQGTLPPALVPTPPAALGALKAGGKALRIAVPDVKVQGDLPPRQLALFETSLLAELRKLEGLSAIGMGEIRELLSYEYQRQMMGCSADENCLAEIGGALGTDEMLQASVVVEGKSATLSLRRINMRQARVTASDQRRLTRANGEELLGAVGPSVEALFPDRALRAGRTRGVAKEVALRLNPPPLPRWPFFATLGAATAAAAGGLVYGSLANDARSQFNALAQRSLSEPVSGSQLKSLESSATSRARTANLLFLGAGGLAVAAGVEAFFTDWRGYRAGVEVMPGGAGVSVGGKF